MNVRVSLCLLAFLVFMGPDAAGCKYTVRDVGFVDLGSEPYRLFISLSGEPGESADNVATELEASLLDANVIGSFLSAADAGASDDAATVATVRQFLDRQEDARRPVGVLVSPDERMRLIEPSADGNDEGVPSNVAAVRSIARAAATSPLRERIADDLLSAHSVVLLVEGNDEAHNETARDRADESIGHIAGSLKSLPKHIANPPKLVVVSQEQAANEATFLWSLGVPSDEPHAAHLAALFGRLRKMGDVLTVPGATSRELSGFLYFVGQDCECELDRSVMQGMMAPHLWDGRLEADAAKALGFDPGHAVVRVEMSRILARGFSSGRRNLGVGFGGSPFDRRGGLGYEEIEIEVLEDTEEEGDRGRGTEDRGQGTEDMEQETGDNEQETTAASQPLAGRDTVGGDPTTGRESEREDRQQETGDQATAEETQPSIVTSLGVTAAILAALVLVISAVVVVARARGGPS